MARLAIVVNPSKLDDPAKVRAELESSCAAAGWEASWLETTEDDPGTGQARQALDDGADIVAAYGGDGTVRAVASALAGTRTPLGLLPGGTGNLLARNLGLPLDDREAALDVILTGRSRPIDVGRVSFDDDDEQLFLVMTGMGLDADMVAANEALKKRIGYLAYVVSGAKALVKPGFRVVVDGQLNVPARVRFRHARTAVVGNCGELTGGIALLPDQNVDDGRLGVVLAAPRGLVGWTAVLADVLTRHRSGYPGIQRYAGPEITVKVDRPVDAQLDGDPVGAHRTLRAVVDPGALLVRVAAESEESR